MTEVIIVGEGQTEEVFIKEILGPALAKNDIFVHPRLIPGIRREAPSKLNGSCGFFVTPSESDKIPM